MLDQVEFAGASSARIATTSILDTIDHPQLFAPWFRKPSTWAGWRVFLAALFGLPVDDADLDLFRRCTGLDAPPSDSFTEAWLVCGRRAGKSFILALVAVYLANFSKVPAIAGLVERDGDDEIDLSNGIMIEIQTASSVVSGVTR